MELRGRGITVEPNQRRKEQERQDKEPALNRVGSNCILSTMQTRMSTAPHYRHNITHITLDYIRLDNCFVPMQCTGNTVCFRRGKRAGRQSAALPSFFIILCFCVRTFSCFHTTVCEAYSFATDGYWIFNVRTHLGACRTHEWRSGTSKSICTRVDSEGQKNCSSPCPCQGIEPRVFGFDFRLSNQALALSYVPRTCLHVFGRLCVAQHQTHHHIIQIQSGTRTAS